MGGGPDADTLRDGNGVDSVNGGRGSDTIDSAQGTNESDTIDGNEGFNVCDVDPADSVSNCSVP